MAGRLRTTLPLGRVLPARPLPEDHRQARLRQDGPSNREHGAKDGGSEAHRNELLSVEGVFPQEQFCVRYTDPSTDRVYVSFVDPDVGKTGDADACLAWKFFLSKDQYASLSLEA
jgi:hypothetical protein